jgi:hypothetical protein
MTILLIAGGVALYAYLFRLASKRVKQLRRVTEVPWWIDFNYDLYDFVAIGCTIAFLTYLMVVLP